MLSPVRKKVSHPLDPAVLLLEIQSWEAHQAIVISVQCSTGGLQTVHGGPSVVVQGAKLLLATPYECQFKDVASLFLIQFLANMPGKVIVDDTTLESLNSWRITG